MDIFEILLYVLVVSSIIAVGLLCTVLFRVNRILARAEKVIAIGEQVSDAILAFESLPGLILKKITQHFFGK
ncbi:MAG: hypothetical protein ACOYN2_01740 [Patescibacteria group bacterium]